MRYERPHCNGHATRQRSFTSAPYGSASINGFPLVTSPVRINIPHMLIGLRELQHESKHKRSEELAYWMWKEVLWRPWLYRLACRGWPVA